MSFEDPNLDKEPASPMDITSMETLATDLITEIPAEVFKEFTCGTDSGAYFSLGTIEHEGDPTPHPSLILTMGHERNEEISLEMGFNFQDELVACRTSDSQLDEAIAIAQELLEDGDFSEEMTIVMRFMQNVLLHVSLGMDSEKAGRYLEATSDNDRPVAELGRALVDEVMGSLALAKQEFGLPVGEDGFVRITTQKIICDADEMDGARAEYGNLSELNIESIQPDGATRRVYNRLLNGTRILEVTPVENGALGSTTPLKKDVEEIITALVDASLTDADTTWLYGS